MCGGSCSLLGGLLKPCWGSLMTHFTASSSKLLLACSLSLIVCVVGCAWRCAVEADTFLLDHLAGQQMAFEVFEARGWEVRCLGVAHLPLKSLLLDEQGMVNQGRRVWCHHLE